jgi:hypothetical protein
MIIERMPEPIDALVITEAFSEETRKAMIEEARSALKKDSGAGVWLNDIYKDIDMSAINQAVVDTVFTEDTFGSMTQINEMYGLFNNVNTHSTMVNYLGHSQSLPMRYDSAAFISQILLFDTPKNFDGGSVTLQVNADSAYEHDVQDNAIIVYPASYYHQVAEVSIKNKDIADSGLYVISSYFFIVP